MFARRWLLGLLYLSIVTALVGCAHSTGLDSIQISPATQALQVGQTAQFVAVGTYGNASLTSTSTLTTGVTWTSSATAVATVNATTGLATAVGAGTTTISANAAAFNGTATSTATLTVTGSSGGTTGGTVTSIAIIPATQSVATPGLTTQFLAIGTTSSGATINLSNMASWSSSSVQIATIGATTGLATAVGQGTVSITVIYTNPSGGSVVTGTATFTVSGGTTQEYTAVTVIPNTETLSSLNQTGQLIALATLGTTGLQTDVTKSAQLTWSSSIPSVASVSATGLVTNLGTGTAVITAVLLNPDGTVVSNISTIADSITAAPQNFLSLAIIPTSITVGNLQDTGQFLAIGTFSTPPATRDLTNSPTLNWISSAPSVFPVNTNTSGTLGATAGIVTAYGTGGAVIIAEATGSDGSIQTATATFNCPLVLPTPTTSGTCYPGSQAPALLATLTVYNEGLNTTNWLVTAPSATGTPGVLHCGPGAGLNSSVCVATYPVGSTVILTAPANGAAFGGWSYNCTPIATVTAVGPNSCTVSLTTNDTVGAIFN